MKRDVFVFPTSFAQRRLWFLDRLAPGEPTYSLLSRLRFSARIADDALALSVRALIDRHESLRTTYSLVDGEPVQIVHPTIDLPLERVDLRALAPDEAAREAERRAAAMSARPFDLERGPLLRLLLVRIEDDEYALFLSIHHIAADGWSLGVLFRDLAELYPALAAGRPSPLAPLPIQYCDYAVWQREALAGPALDGMLGYWRRQLADLPELALPADRPHAAERGPANAYRFFTLPAPLVAALASLGQREGCTLFMTLLAAFFALLHRHSGQDDLAVGTPIAGRTRAELEGLVGVFVNTLALRVDLTADPTFTRLLERVRRSTLDAYTHQDCPFELVVEALRPQRHVARNPLVQVMFHLQNAPRPAGERTTGGGVDLPSGGSAFDLAIDLWRSGDDLAGRCEYDPGLFDAATIERLLARFSVLLTAVAEDPSRPISALPLLPADELALLDEWSAPPTSPAPSGGVHTWFTAQAQRTPDSIALRANDEQLSFRVLHQYASRLARRLRRAGVAREQRVALFLPRSLGHGVAVLGVLMAGAAFLSLDPAHPPAHLAELLRAARPRVVLYAGNRCALTSALDLLIEVERPLVLAVDGEDIGEDPNAGDDAPVAVAPADLAYVVFTSGTLGKPKGIEVEHRALARRISAVQPHYRLRAGDRVLHFASFGFDASIEELLAPWFVGAAVVLRPDEPFATFAELHRFIERERLTVLCLPTAYWHAWVAELVRTGERVPAGVSMVIVGSEPALPERVRSWQQIAPKVRWVNAYGPAEAVITATLDEPRELQPPGEPVAIGRPIAGSEARVLDPRGALVPLGAPGELHLGGDGLARGYLGDPVRTATSFVTGRGGSRSDRLYRTGDRVRWRGDGRLVFLGRIDEQVKIRGVRVEPAAIEAVLGEHPDVRAAAVVADEIGPGDRQLVAHVVGDVAPDELRRFLAERVPPAMIPAAFVAHAALPLTPNGKLDRRALPRVTTIEVRTTAPRSPGEHELARLWAAVLQLPVADVDVDADFFRAGGHSLLATQLLSRIRESLQVELSLRQFFEHPTVAGLAALVEVSPRSEPRAPELRRRTRAPLSFAQQRLWFLHQLSPTSPFYNIPLGLRLTAPLDPEVLERCLAEIVRRHEILRTSFPAPDGKPIQSIAPDLTITLERVDHRGRADAAEATRRLVHEAARRPFDLARDPLLRAWLIDEADDAQILLLVLHHIVADGWSIGVLLRELSALYPALRAGEPSPLPGLAAQYADFAVQQREQLQGEPLARLLDHWRRQLHGLQTLALPTDRPRPTAPSFRGARHFVSYDAALTPALRALGESEGCTLFMSLLAAFYVLLHRYTGQVDLAVGSAIANRTRPELEDLLGFFVNSLVLRGDLSGDPSFRGLLRRVRALALDAYTHQDLPFERLVEELQPERSLARNPLVQVMFALQNAPLGGLTGASADSLEIERGTANFDLVFDLWERPDGRLGGRLEYSTDLFDDATIRRMSRQFETLLASVIAEPTRPISAIPLLDEAEREQVLRAWNATTTDYPRDRTLIDLFREQVQRDPGATAIVHGDREWSYHELELASDRLAHDLIALGVEPGARVGLYLERSLELIVAQLAVLKVGAAYVPLDLEYPHGRLAAILEETAAAALISRRSLADKLPPGAARVVWVDDERPPLTDAAPPRRRAPDGLAHIIYTSGSTGRPKGICVPERAVIRLVRDTDYVRLGPGDRIAHASNTAFDAATFEIWGALLNGGALVIAERDVVLSPPEFAAFLSARRISTLFVTTALFNQLVAAEPGVFAPLREVLFGGEQVDPRRVRQVLGDRPPRRLLHVYGPTESTTFATWQLVNEVPADAATVPIGRPIANTRAYVLDAHLEPAPIGVPGELYLGGDGLALGYFLRPELTAASFIDSPFGDGRLYRTGDLVRWRADGALEFLRRADAQVKIRGFRIEPGEIEAALRQHPAVRDVAVVPQELRGERRLVAYVVQADADADDVDDWRKIYDEVVYEGVDAADDLELNTTGWRSSYTGEPLTAEEMREQVEQTVARMLSVAPRRVLEIGVGTGMLLFQVAPRCEAYVATDFSRSALGFIDQALAARPLPQVTLLERTATDFTGIEPGSFDLVVLNSVIQYFPSAAYLREVLTQAARALRPGGHIYCGDVRSLPLLKAFHADVELSRAPGELRLEQLRPRVQRRLDQEEELVVDPAAFLALGREIDGVGPARVWPKRGHQRNELMRFRFDAMIPVGDAGQTQDEWPRRDWSELGSREALLNLLDRDSPDLLHIEHIPNERVAAAVRAAQLLAELDGTVAELRRAATVDAIDPESLWQICDERPYDVELRCGEGPTLELLLRRRGLERPWPPASLPSPRPLAERTTDPRRGRSARRLARELRAHLLARLPEYMVPTAFVPLPALPLTPNGKLDRRALPAVEDAHTIASAAAPVAPRSELEAALAGLWAEVLGVERVGVRDNFFELGGHSLLVTQLVSRIRDALRLEVTIRAVFEAPTVAEFAAALAGAGAPAEDSIVPRPRDGGVPLSFAQERLWFLAQMFPDSPIYNIRTAIRTTTPLDPATLQRSLDALLRRQDILRTTFTMRGDRPIQVVADEPDVSLERIDLRGVPADRRESAAARHIHDIAARRFDLERGPVLRAALLELDDREQIVLLVVHHIAADGWSLGVLYRELSALYAALAEGRPPALPELKIQYADVAMWQRERLGGPAREPLLAYWRERLANLPTLRLPTDAPRSPAPAHRGGLRTRTLPAELSSAVLSLGRAAGCTLFMTLLAALFAVLHRATGQTDFAVGSPIANRTRAELEGLVGFFLNTLVLRLDLAGDPSFRELMARARDVSLGAYAHQELPFELLLQEFRLERDISRTPLFQVFFNVLNFSDPNVSAPVLRARGEDDDEVVAQFDLALYAGELDGQVVFQLIHDADLFTPATAERLLEHLERLLAAATLEPDRSLSRLLAFPDDARAARPRPRPSGVPFERFDAAATSIPARFLEVVRRDPDRLAVITGETSTTYRQLAERAAGVAAALGPRPDQRIALLFEPGSSMLAAILGVLMTGAAYVPLDRAHPPRRLRAIVELADVSLVLTDASGRGLAHELVDTTAIDVDSLTTADPPRSLESIDPDAPAYILFTSGSSGEPKGVVQSQRNVLRHIAAYTNALEITAGDGLILLASYGFDAAVMDIFGALLNGAALHPVDLRSHGPEAASHALARGDISIYHSTPTVFRELPTDRTYPGVRLVVLGGEPVVAADLERFRGCFPADCVLVNGLGPTESTLALQQFLDRDTPVLRPSVPVGHPVEGMRVHLLDESGAEVGIHGTGELVLEGDALALGYWRRPDLTAAAFSGGVDGAPRRYRTGDLGRRLPDGSVEYVGRKDAQVKIRGQRIELGEIEARLAEHPAILQAAVAVHPDPRGEPALCAHAVLRPDEAEPTLAELRRFLRLRLPDAMLPSRLVVQPGLPRTPTGKLDRRALPPPPATTAPTEVAPPRTPTEAALIAMMAALLGVDRLGVDDDFFLAGGHSLLATRLISQVRDSLGVELPLRTIFESPTPAGLALAVAGAAAAPRPIAPRPRDRYRMTQE